MPLQANAVDLLIEKGSFRSDVALAIAEAIDVTIQAYHQFTLLPLLDARFAKLEAGFATLEARFTSLEAKSEARFASLEKSMESSVASMKVWAMTAYVGLAVTLFGALAVDTYWEVTREDQAIAQMQARSDQKFQQIDARLQRYDEHFQQIDARFQRVDERFQQMDAHFQRVDAELQEIHALLIKHNRRESK